MKMNFRLSKHWLRFTCKLVCFSFLFTNSLTAQQQDLWTTFTNANGLASNDVQAIAETRDGAIWFGTDGGVSRFQDGLWTSFTSFDGFFSN